MKLEIRHDWVPAGYDGNIIPGMRVCTGCLRRKYKKLTGVKS